MWWSRVVSVDNGIGLSRRHKPGVEERCQRSSENTFWGMSAMSLFPTTLFLFLTSYTKEHTNNPIMDDWAWRCDGCVSFPLIIASAYPAVRNQDQKKDATKTQKIHFHGCPVGPYVRSHHLYLQCLAIGPNVANNPCDSTPSPPCFQTAFETPIGELGKT